ncbi:basic-leucine zipper transcription factor A-like [Bacillus rossius redtenbacheri]|uniref:basic-leucine zipper transcription factor A-like n=1 Tax=Bacillus rossius redtenbacheri TaxID=93214 RepID=UPI002FDD2D7D
MRVETDLREILNSTLDQLSRDVHEATEETLQMETEYGDSLLKDMVYACDFLQPLLICKTAPVPPAPEKQESVAEELDQDLGCNDEFTMKELAEKVFQDTFNSSDVDLHTKHPKKRPAKCSEIKKHPPNLSTSTPSKMPLNCKKLVSKMELNSKPAHCMPEQHQQQQKPKCQPTPQHHQQPQQQQQQQPQQQPQCRKFSKLLLLGRFEAVDSMSLPPPAPGFPHTSPQQYPGLVTMQPQTASYDLGSGPKLDVRITFSPDCSQPPQPQQCLQAPPQHQQSRNACSNAKQSAHQPLCAPAHHAPGHHGPLPFPCKPPAGGSAHGLAKGAPSGGSGLRIKMTSSSKLCVSGGQQSAEMCQAGEMSMEMPQHGRGTETKSVQVPDHRRPATPGGSQTGFHFTQTQQFSMGNMEQRLEAAKTHLKSQSQPHQSQQHQPQVRRPRGLQERGKVVPGTSRGCGRGVTLANC